MWTYEYLSRKMASVLSSFTPHLGLSSDTLSGEGSTQDIKIKDTQMNKRANFNFKICRTTAEMQEKAVHIHVYRTVVIKWNREKGLHVFEWVRPASQTQTSGNVLPSLILGCTVWHIFWIPVSLGSSSSVVCDENLLVGSSSTCPGWKGWGIPVCLLR